MSDSSDPVAYWAALNNFVRHFRIRADERGLYHFDADISFRSIRDVDERTRVYISLDHNAVSPLRFAEHGELNPVNVHTEFRPGNNVVKFDNQELQIMGTSPKLGRFTVRIAPLATS
jgi:hypothetical protein